MDGLTSNKLILFQDGFYIELIASNPEIDPALPHKHRWGFHPENTIIDWAYALSNESDFAAVKRQVQQSGTFYEYGDALAGGRIREGGG